MADEIFKAVAEVVKQATPMATGGLLVALGATGKKILGVAESELDSYFGPSQRMRTIQRGIEAVGKAEAMLNDAGVSGKAKTAALKFIVPWFEGASLEEDESLHDMWAALLANASLPSGDHQIRPSFIGILKQMSPDEASVLQEAYQNALRQTFEGMRWIEPPTVYLREILFMNSPKEAFEKAARKDSAIDALKAYGLLGSPSEVLVNNSSELIEVNHRRDGCLITRFGLSFVEACQPPKPAEPKQAG